MPAETAVATPTTPVSPPAVRGDGVAIEIREVSKTFLVPSARVDTLKERAVHPFRRREQRTLEALRSVSFDVGRGEFLGIVGRNGSGKSTLLKIIASIYRADRGSVRIAGRLAPFIELGVGFNPELTARDNVVLNGAMMGLSTREARRRFDAVMAFAELEEFAGLRLKNYSSGMLVRLAFSVMLEADADVLLFDEVLAVGDAAFQQKCADAFRQMRGEGKTIVLVTHDMGTVERNCHRALVLERGRIERIGTPEEVARVYLEENLKRHQRSAGPRDRHAFAGEGALRFVDVRLEDEAGSRIDGARGGEPITVRATVEAGAELQSAFFSFEVRTGDGSTAVIATPYHPLCDPDDRLQPGDRLRIGVTIDAPPGMGNYFIHCALARDPDGGGQLALRESAASFVIYEPKPGHGELRLNVTVEREPR